MNLQEGDRIERADPKVEGHISNTSHSISDLNLAAHKQHTQKPPLYAE